MSSLCEPSRDLPNATLSLVQFGVVLDMELAPTGIMTPLSEVGLESIARSGRVTRPAKQLTQIAPVTSSFTCSVSLTETSSLPSLASLIG